MSDKPEKIFEKGGIDGISFLVVGFLMFGVPPSCGDDAVPGALERIADKFAEVTL